MTLEVEVHRGEGLGGPLPERAVRDAVLHVLRAEAVERAEISVALVADGEIAALNERFLGHAGPTDVLSFHLHPPGEPPVGDVYVGAEQAARQAAELGVPLEQEIVRLAVHGTLHVLGYDHPEEGREGSPMFRRQEELLASWAASRGSG